MVQHFFLHLLSQPKLLQSIFSGTGHFGVRGEARTAPSFQDNGQTFLAIDRSFSLMGEARINDNASVFLDTRLWTSPKNSYAGENAATDSFSGDNSYDPFTASFTQAYASVGTEYCLLEAGRRARDWGLGVYLDSGMDAFDTAQSVFDGVGCDVNIQKSQNLGFSLGYDKIAEGSPLTSGDDIEQYYISVEFDDRSTSTSSFSKHIALYLANYGSSGDDSVGAVDYKVFDLYAAFYLGNLNIKGEAVFRTGKSEEAGWSQYGGTGTSNHSVDSIAFALRSEWTFMSSGNIVGIKPYESGSAKRHLAFFEYFRAPGDESGYYKGTNDTIGSSERTSAAEAFAFHENFKPAMLLFNGRQGSEDMNIDGIYDSNRLMNANVFSFGYKFESVENGTLEAKLINASLLIGMPSDVKDYFDNNNAPADYYNLAGQYPVGYFGDDIGTEINVSYKVNFAKSFDVEIAGAYAMPGDALKVTDNEPKTNTALQTSMSMSF